MADFAVGDKLKDNDPRVGNRVLTITQLLANCVIAKDCVGNERRYSRHRIFTDGKLRRSGLSLVKAGAPCVS